MVAAIVVLYHPQHAEVLKNLASYAEVVDRLLLWRNSPEEFTIPDPLLKKTVLLGTGENDYMALPLNTALKWCSNNGFDYLLTMDQDSAWDDAGYFLKRALSRPGDSTAIYSPYVQGQYTKPDHDYDAESVITSGSLVNVQIALKLGGFREDYKIYWVDGEFCYWARLNGYKIRVLHDCTLFHEFGKQTKTLFGFTTSNYSPAVYYYLIRNMLWMKREFPKGVSIKTVLYTLMYSIRGILLGEKQKCIKLHSINKAIFHGLSSKINKRPSLV